MKSNCMSLNRSLSSSHYKVECKVIWIYHLSIRIILKSERFHTRKAFYNCVFKITVC
ncbi:hypothetical protein OIU77_018118 [Salix suchowensis]|uniref:Uncharacterized protein n=1 Tax=Salix suchowensis TaxID=1278906 RepID=A0ABQ8ZRB4_9ROSI|nr:hypothetical protein OIU77_018118 [Salix suchowensis]